MLMLRLSRAGSKKRPVYHLVAADRRARRDGRFIENLGYYWPARDILVLKQDRIDHWLSVGAQMTDTARALVRKARREGNTEPVAKPRPQVVTATPEAPKAEAKKDAPKAAAPKGEKAPEAPVAAAAEAPKTETASTETKAADAQ
ncbi:MAG: 30S ribosomal protein S16 [Myxococcota bacterium]